MNLPFDTHKIYITLENNTFYELHSDFSKTEIDFNEIRKQLEDRKNGIIVLHKSQFEYNKTNLLDKKFVGKLSDDLAKTYCRMGFITESELEDFLEL